MNDFDAMSNGDLILCANLLRASARELEKSGSRFPNDVPAYLPADRRALALRLEKEVDRRGAACCLTKGTT